MKTVSRITLLAMICGASLQCAAAGLDDLRAEWAHVKYELPAGEQLAAMMQLKGRADAALQAAPQDAGLMIWDAIITSSAAGLKGGLSALGMAKEARAKLEQAEQRQPGALGGSALTSLGALYYQVPGWPIGFGDHKKARNLLQAALKIDPDGIDSNYFYADFLFSEGDLAAARQAAEHGLAAAPRPGREVADRGRREELRALIARIGARSRG
jgi:tetratricopeptide (TPR) repeat protein